MVDNKSFWAYNNGIVNNKEQEMHELLINDEIYFGMFTERGNRVIHGIVIAAKELNWSFEEVMDLLNDIATVEEFAEASDTAVREYVYEAIYGYGE
jgi:hypothetical protein